MYLYLQNISQQIGSSSRYVPDRRFSRPRLVSAAVSRAQGPAALGSGLGGGAHRTPTGRGGPRSDDGYRFPQTNPAPGHLCPESWGRDKTSHFRPPSRASTWPRSVHKHTGPAQNGSSASGAPPLFPAGAVGTRANLPRRQSGLGPWSNGRVWYLTSRVEHLVVAALVVIPIEIAN